MELFLNRCIQRGFCSFVILVLYLVFVSGCCNTKVLEHDIQIVAVIDSNLLIVSRGITKKGIKEGYWISTTLEGIINAESVYKNGKINGLHRAYFESGRLMSETEMKNDQSDGYDIGYYENGVIHFKGQYNKGKMVGIWEEYTLRGELDRKILYQKDTSIILLDNHLGMPSPAIRSLPKN